MPRVIASITRALSTRFRQPVPATDACGDRAIAVTSTSAVTRTADACSSALAAMRCSGATLTTSRVQETKRRLREAVEWPLLHGEAFRRLGLQPAQGVLLYGPPGCSKTSLLRVIASSIQANLVALSAGQLYSMCAPCR